MNKLSVSVPSITVFILLMLLGCKKELNNSQIPEDIPNSSGWEITERSGGPTVLGDQKANPYKVETILQAYNNLYEPNLTALSANYLYVRFLPQSTQDVKLMLESDIEFWDTPLDYEITTWGERYHDPSLANSEFTYQYAVVKTNTILPAVQHQVLEHLALVPEDCAIAQEAFNITGNTYSTPDEFVANPSIVNGTFDFNIDRETSGGDGGGTGGDCGCPLPDHSRKPSGCVQVFDNMLNAWEGVINVEVHTARTQLFGNVFHRETETNANGCWMINHKYHGKINVWVKWENGTCDVKTMESYVDLWGYTFPRKAYIGKFGGPNFNNVPIKFDFTNALNTFDFRNWVASSVNNSVFEFGGFVASQGISRSVPGDLQILINPYGSGGNSAAAPMLDKLGPVQQFILYGSVNAIMTRVLGVMNPLLAYAGPIATWLEVVAPDISINLNFSGNVNADDIRELSYHELSHALHFVQVGSAYWLDNIKYTMLHFGYGDGTAPGAGRCSVIESWGFQIGMNATHLRYGANNSNPGNTATNTWRARLERDLAWTVESGTAHVPYAWEWDLQDDNTTNPSNEFENVAVTDRVSGVTNAQIYSTMTSGMLSMPQMKTAIAPFLPVGTTTATYNLLCLPYGY